MKKIALILLLNIYALASFGISIRQFYCCGQLKSTGISFTQNGTKKGGNSDENDGCCKTKYQTFKVKDSHTPGYGVSIPIVPFTDLQLFATSPDLSLLISEPRDVENASHAPPLHHNIPIYLLNCIYRI